MVRSRPMNWSILSSCVGIILNRAGTRDRCPDGADDVRADGMGFGCCTAKNRKLHWRPSFLVLRQASIMSCGASSFFVDVLIQPRIEVAVVPVTGPETGT